MVQESQEAKSKTQALSDKAAFWLTIIAVTVGIATLAGWLIAGRDLTFSIQRMATVMVITCPHALGLAIPLVVAVSTSRSAKNGLLIRNRTSFENARNITTVLFDKTGTLTTGDFKVQNIQPLDQRYDETEVLSAAAALEQRSEHSIGKAIMDRAAEEGISVGEVEGFQALAGAGIEGTVNGNHLGIVSSKYLRNHEIEVPESYNAKTGATEVFLTEGDHLVGVMTLADTIREEAYRAVEALHDREISCWMVTGDNDGSAQTVADALQMDGYFAEVPPEQKREKVIELQERGEFVAMTGDGINDAPALAQAQVGIAVGSGTDVAAETADIILINSNPRDVVSTILFGRATYRKMVQNLLWATGYNVVAIPLAAGALFWAGIMISPALGALLMSLSTVIVAINAKLLRIEKQSKYT
jgi:Cu2+-exporting ATPase